MITILILYVTVASAYFTGFSVIVCFVHSLFVVCLMCFADVGVILPHPATYRKLMVLTDVLLQVLQQ